MGAVVRSVSMVAPVLEKLSRDFAGALKVVKVNVDESPETAQRYPARSIPMLLFISDGARHRNHRRSAAGTRAAGGIEAHA